MSYSVQPHGQQPPRLSHSWGSPGKNTGVGCHFLLQCMQVKSETEVAQSRPTLCDPMDCSLPGSSVHGIFQARALEWGAIPFSENTMGYSPHKQGSNISILHRKKPKVMSCYTLIDLLVQSYLIKIPFL